MEHDGRSQGYHTRFTDDTFLLPQYFITSFLTAWLHPVDFGPFLFGFAKTLAGFEFFGVLICITWRCISGATELQVYEQSGYDEMI